MSKRFTDIKKWRNQWFRELPDRAKLTWIYLCDECESYGVWKADYGLASYQLGFSINQQKLQLWFGDKIHFFDTDKVLIVQFFEFQYGTTKDSWTAKLRAKEKLEYLGFTIINNKVVLDKNNHSTPTVLDSVPTGLIEGVGIGEGKVNYINTAQEKENLPALALLWNEHCGSLAKVRGTNAARNIRIKERLKEEPNLMAWAEVIQSVAKSDFCNGKSPTRWKADFDWLLQPEVRLKVLEGKYENRINSQDPFSLINKKETA